MLAKTTQIIREKKIIAVLLAMVVITYLASTLRNSALPWAISSLVLATALVGYVWPRWLVRNLQITRSLPDRAQEGEDVPFRLAITNTGIFPRFMVEVFDRVPFAGASVEKSTLLAVVAHLAGGRTANLEVTVKADCRGRHRLGPVELRSGFPLGLIDSSVEMAESTAEIVIYPHLFAIHQIHLQGNHRLQFLDDLPLSRTTGAAEFTSLRDYRRGDHPKHIHWASTARLNKLVVKEYESVGAASLTVVPNLSATELHGKGRESTMEYGIKIAGSAAEYACHNGIPVRVVLAPADADNPQLSNATAFGEILDRLAVVGSTDDDYSITLSHAVRAASSWDNLLVFVAADGKDKQTIANLLAEAVAKQIHVIAVLFNAHSFAPVAKLAGDPMTIPRIQLAGAGASVIEVRRGDDLTALFAS